MTGEKKDCVGADMTSLKAAMSAPAWSKYKLSNKMASGGACSPVNATATGNCFSKNKANYEVWCSKAGGDASCMNQPKWLSRSDNGKVGTKCGQ